MLSAHQSGFRLGDSCICELISIVHEIYNIFDVNHCEISSQFRGVEIRWN